MENYRQINKIIGKNLREFHPENRNKIKSLIVIVSVFLTSMFIASAFLVNRFSDSKSIASAQNSAKQEEQESQEKPKTSILKTILSAPKALSEGITEPTTILALGRPGEGWPGGNLTDTILLIHLIPQNKEKQAVLISIPRDLIVKAPSGQMTKINSLYHLTGVNGLAEKLEQVTGLKIEHHIIVDLVVVEELIALVDGLNVYVPQDINDFRFPGPNYTYDAFVLKAGWRYLDGGTALKYIRTRYTSPNGDFDRMARQQQIIQLLKRKVLSLNPLWDFPTYLKLYKSLNKHIETDLSILNITSLWHTAKSLDPDKINSIVVDKKETNLLVGNQVMFGSQLASVVQPKAGQENYDDIKKYISSFIK